MNAYFTPCIFIFALTSFTALANVEDPKDSVQAKKQKQHALRITARTHSGGFFYFGGRLSERNPAFDVNVTVEGKHFGYTFFKAMDLTDIHSSFNFALAGLFKNININQKLRVTPQVLVLIEQPNHIVDEGSDVGVTFTTAYKFNDQFSIDETVIVFNVAFETSELDMINRLRLLYTKKHVDVILMGWHNNQVLDHDYHVTSALSIGYNRIKVNDRLNVGASLMASSTMLSSNIADTPKKNGLTASLTATFH